MPMPASLGRSIISFLSERRFWLALSACLLSFRGSLVDVCHAYTARSPEVRAVVEKALEFLGEADHREVGGKALVGLVFVKERQSEHPKVQEAINACLEYAERPIDKLLKESKFYNLPVAVIFLCELDAGTYYAQIEKLLEVMRRRQQRGGGWGYSFRNASNVGDTSMTQYCILAAWTAHRSGMQVSGEMMGKACDWLLRTQTPEGGSWGYQGSDPGVNKPPKKQLNVRLSLTAAATGSIYICADLFGVSPIKSRSDAEVDAVVESSEDTGIPSAFRPASVAGSISMEDVATSRMAKRMRAAMADGDEHLAENFTVRPKEYPFYYLYALERYHSFREIVSRRIEREPKWYNEAFEHLEATQQPDGSWASVENDVNVVPSTAFATLFLLRSSLKSLQAFGRFGEGLLVGGRGLPRDLSGIRMQDGRVVGRREHKALADILVILENPDHPQFSELEQKAGSTLVVRGTALDAADVARLRRLVRGGDYKVRRLAVQALSARRDFNDIPTFIYAISDPDDQVSLAARNALRFVSRRFDGFGLSDQPTKADKQAAAAAWKNWYQAIHPSAEATDGG